MDSVYVNLQNSINSDGLWYPSISIYYSGCDKPTKCPDCHNPELQLCRAGFRTTTAELIDSIEKELIEWLSVYPTIAICYLGGEPLAEWNRDSVFKVSEYFKTMYKKQICNILYTWRYIEELHSLPLIQYLTYMDYCVLGEFQIQDRDIDYIPSSSNQYIYDFKSNKILQPIKKGL